MRTHHTISRTAWSMIASGICLVAAASLAAISPAPDAQRQQPPSILLESVDGADSFQRYCATCHGRSGKGDGQVAAALNTKPADLTQLARRNNGLYPADRVRAVVAGYGAALPAHGLTDMPVWGPIFRALDSSDVRVAVRIDNIVEYLGNLQEPSTGSSGLGAQLFKTHCAVCHGGDARGTGTATSELRRRPPDLTEYTARNGGVFPRERVYQIIDGRYVPSHGDRDMPIWGDAFSRSRDGLSEAGVRSRIDAIVNYLEMIQRRSAE
jgi:mono/diheme cytochrome c family protein